MGSKSKASASSASKEEKRESKQVRLLEEAKAKLECKVDMLATMVAMKDECLKASDERLLALKWELLANHRGDEEKLHALAQALRERCHGWGGEAPADGTRAVCEQSHASVSSSSESTALKTCRARRRGEHAEDAVGCRGDGSAALRDVGGGA